VWKLSAGQPGRFHRIGHRICLPYLAPIYDLRALWFSERKILRIIGKYSKNIAA
jgi:hypothetical protein